MTVYEIKEYLSSKRLKFDDKITRELEHIKKEAVLNENERLANEIWCLQQIFHIQKTYVSMFNCLKEGKYDAAWHLLERIDIELCFLRSNFDYSGNKYNMTFIESAIKQYEKVFPDYIYTSRETAIKSERCSICGKRASLRGGCNHRVGKLYMGELCTREVIDFEFIGMAIVRKPFDKYAVMKIEGVEYNYGVLNFLMSKVESPFTIWYLEQMKRKKPEFMGTERNDLCPCGSGKKYKKCCMGTQKEWMPHNRITIAGGRYLKETPII